MGPAPSPLVAVAEGRRAKFVEDFFMRARCWVCLATAGAALLKLNGALAAPPKAASEAPNSSREQATSPLRCDAQGAWQRVRAAYPIHAQILAKCASRDGNQQTIVLTEPPPHLTRSKAEAIAVSYTHLTLPTNREV